MEEIYEKEEEQNNYNFNNKPAHNENKPNPKHLSISYSPNDEVREIDRELEELVAGDLIKARGEGPSKVYYPVQEKAD